MKIWKLMFWVAVATISGVCIISTARAETVIASYYCSGQRVASGGRYNPHGMTAAHRTLPFGTKIRVINHANGKSVVLTVNDRGPFIRGRGLDVSCGAASILGMKKSGLARVTMTRL